MYSTCITTNRGNPKPCHPEANLQLFETSGGFATCTTLAHACLLPGDGV